MNWSIGVLWILLFLVVGWSFYRVPVLVFLSQASEEWSTIRGKRKLWKWLVRKIEPYIGKSILVSVERLIRLSGNPMKIKASELILFEFALVVVGIFISFGVHNGKVAFIGVWSWFVLQPLVRLYKQVKERQLEARVTIRFLKRRLNTDLKLGNQIEDSLRDISSYAPSGFGKVFRESVHLIGSRPLRSIMKELRELYDVRELDSFCIAIEQCDRQGSFIILPDLLDQQIEEEKHRTEEYIRHQTETIKPKLYGIAAMIFALTMSVTGYFIYLYIKMQANQGNFFFGL